MQGGTIPELHARIRALERALERSEIRRRAAEARERSAVDWCRRAISRHLLLSEELAAKVHRALRESGAAPELLDLIAEQLCALVAHRQRDLIDHFHTPN